MSEFPNFKDFLSVNDVVEMYGVDKELVMAAVDVGDIEAYKIGRRVYLRPSSVTRWAMFPSRSKKTRVYFIQEGEDGLIKIGESNDPGRRLVDHQCGNPRRLRLLGSFAARSYIEREVQKQFVDDRVSGEWFRPTPELLAYIAERCK